MINLKNISKSFNEKTIFKEINLSIFEREIIALIGSNGSGKSTLLKIMAGILKPDSGKIEMLSDLKIAYFPQEIPLEHRNITAKNFLANQFKINSEKIYGIIADLLGKLEFSKEKLDSKIKNLSDGEKSKLMLISIIKSRANIFLLDEPTNNLDLRGLIILEKFINASSCGFFIVSHDRKFLEKLSIGIVEINENTHNIEIYHNCRYVDYLNTKKKDEEKEIKKYENYIKEKERLIKTAIDKKQEAQKMQKGSKIPRDRDKFIPSFKKDRSKKIASQASQIELRIEKLEVIKKPKYHLPLNLNFSFSERSGDLVFSIQNVKYTNNNFIIGPINLEVHYKDRIVIIGPNGGGKSTFLKLLTENKILDDGFIRTGMRVKIGYLQQELIFNDQDNILNYFLHKTDIQQSNARKILARFGFFEDDVKSLIKTLSPGEKSRLILATLMANEVNCLILDEPTNHLDPEALDRLEEALKNFEGTIIIVSHDRYFIDKIKINKTYLMENGNLTSIKDYHEYEKTIL